MSFYLRKSIKVGPIRFNLSKSGIGVSGGVKGLRVGTGPRGNYIHMGRGGIYYRKTLGGGKKRGASGAPQRLYQEPFPSGGMTPPEIPEVPMTEIESSDVSQMSHSSSVELLRELHDKKNIARIGPWVLGGGIILFLVALSASFHPFLLLIIAVSVGIGSVYAFQRDEVLKTAVLFYDFDPVLEQAYGVLHAGATQLAQCAGCWHIAASGNVHDSRYHAGASKLVDRKATTIRAESPHFLKTNIQTVAIAVGRQTLYFFPDRMLIFASGRVGAVGYDELTVSVSQRRFIEDTAPQDAQVVDHTWRYVNKNGSPDRRFANNRQLPVCLYDEIHFASRSGINEIIQVSRAGIGQGLEQAIRQLAKYTRA